MITYLSNRESRFWISALGLFVLSLAVYGWQASNSAMLDRSLAERDRYLAAFADRRSVDPAIEEAESEAYWRRYPDVAADLYYGRGGPLGVLGARQHYRDHGYREGRQWTP